MIKAVRVVNSYGEELTMTLRNPGISGYIITGITGLEPVDVDIKQSQFVSGLKYKYNKGFFKFRNIQLAIVYDEWNLDHKTIDELRLGLYDYFKPNDLITLYFTKDDDTVKCIQGYVDKHGSSYFTNESGATISITCPDPWFRKNSMEYEKYVDIILGRSNSRINTAQIGTAQIDDSEHNDYGYEALITEEDVYEGDIQTGIRIDFSKDVLDMLGSKIIIESQHSSSGQNGFLEINPSNNYIPNIPYTPGDFRRYLVVDHTPASLLQDVIIYKNGSSYMVTFEISVSDGYFYLNDATIHNKEEFDEVFGDEGYGYDPVTGPEGISFICHVDGNGRLYTKSTDEIYYIRTFDAYSGLRVNTNDVNIPSDLYLEIDTHLDNLTIIVKSNQSDAHDNVIGWLDVNSISNRKNLPMIYKGNNRILINSTIDLENLNRVGRVYYHTLYRGI